MNNHNSNGNKHNSNGNESTTSNGSSTPNHDSALNHLAEQARSAVAGAKAAEMPYVAEAISRQEQAFQADTDAIAETLAVYLDPRAKLLAGYIKAANIVQDKPDFLPIPKGGYRGILPELPSVPDFGSYYSASTSAAPALTATASNPGASSSETISPGNSNGAQGKGFGTRRSDS